MRVSSMETTKIILALWGRGKVGKTVFASQFPNNHYIGIKEDGLGSVRSMRAKYNLSFDFPVYLIDDNPTTDPDLIAIIGEAFARLSGWQKINKLATVLCSKLGPDDFITLDHLTNLSDLRIESLEKANNRKMQIQDWGSFVADMGDFLQLFKQNTTKCSTLILAHDDMLKDDVSGEIIRSVMMPTRMKNSFPSFPTEYLYMKNTITGATNVRRVNRLLQSIADQNVNAGSYAMIPDILDPTYEKVRPYLEASLGRKLPDACWTPESKP
jgi:hypothetical protein